MGRCVSKVLLLFLFSWGFLQAQEAPVEPDLLIPKTEGQIDQWLKFGKPKGFATLPPKERKKLGPPIKLSLADVVRSTLKNQWKVQIAERGVDKQCGIAFAAGGPFDPNLGTALKSTWMIDTQVFGFKSEKSGDIDTLRVFVEKLTRLGTRFALDGKVEREHNPAFLFGNPYNRTNQTVLTFLIDQPLLKRFKYNEESVNEIVNDLEFKALQEELVQTMALNVRTSLFQYWDLVSARKAVTINENAEIILEGLASATEYLVEGERVAASELNEQFAELARNNKQLIASEQEVFRNFNLLLFDMGLERCRFPMETPNLDLEDFPAFVANRCDWNLDHLQCLAVKNRGDLVAAQTRICETQWQVRLAQQDIYPNLDLRLGYDFFNSQINQAAKPFFSSSEDHNAQKKYSVEVNFSLPLFNIKARGERTRRLDEKAQAVLEQDQLQEEILSDVTSAFRNQLELLDQIYYANESVKWYEKALQDEIMRYKEGEGSLFIVIDFENRLRRTLIEEVSVQAEWAKNIVQLLFLTGTLIQNDPCCSNQVQIDMFNYEKLLRRKAEIESKSSEESPRF